MRAHVTRTHAETQTLVRACARTPRGRCLCILACNTHMCVHLCTYSTPLPTPNSDTHLFQRAQCSDTISGQQTLRVPEGRLYTQASMQRLPSAHRIRTPEQAVATGQVRVRDGAHFSALYTHFPCAHINTHIHTFTDTRFVCNTKKRGTTHCALDERAHTCAQQQCACGPTSIGAVSVL